MCKTSNAIWNGDSTNEKGSGGNDRGGGNENANILTGTDTGKLSMK